MRGKKLFLINPSLWSYVSRLNISECSRSTREPATTHAPTDRAAFHIPHPFTIIRYLPAVSIYRLLVLLKPPIEGYSVILC